jgi:hypothetical protein
VNCIKALPACYFSLALLIQRWQILTWNEEVFLIGIYVYYHLAMWKDCQISNLNVDLNLQRFNLKVGKDLMNYLSCCVVEYVDKSKIFTL